MLSNKFYDRIKPSARPHHHSATIPANLLLFRLAHAHDNHDRDNSTLNLSPAQSHTNLIPSHDTLTTFRFFRPPHLLPAFACESTLKLLALSSTTKQVSNDKIKLSQLKIATYTLPADNSMTEIMASEEPQTIHSPPSPSTKRPKGNGDAPAVPLTRQS